MVRRITVEHMFRQRPDFGRKLVEGPGFDQTGIAQRPLGIVVAGDKPPPATAGQGKAMDRLGGAQVSIVQVGVAPGRRTEWIPQCRLCHWCTFPISDQPLTVRPLRCRRVWASASLAEVL